MTELTGDAEDQATEEAGEVRRSLRPADLVDLFTRPRLFFAGHLDLAQRRFLLPVAWALGISTQMDRIDTEILRHSFSEDRVLWNVIEPVVTGPWLAYWAWVLGLGVISAVVVYFVGGWWYRMRLRFSGGKELEVGMPRYVYAYSSFVVSLPQILVSVAYTLIYPNYLAAYNSSELISSVVLLFVFWSVAVSYSGATEAFELVRWKARLWFLGLPVVFYLVVLGGIMWLFTIFQ